MVIAWLIEDEFAPQARWWCGGDVFSTDANSAVRFSRKEDADRVRLTTLARTEFPLVATEHGWHDETEASEQEKATLRAELQACRMSADQQIESYRNRITKMGQESADSRRDPENEANCECGHGVFDHLTPESCSKCGCSRWHVSKRN
jgi:hypothetical protein